MPTLAIIAHHIRKHIHTSDTVPQLTTCLEWIERVLIQHGSLFAAYSAMLLHQVHLRDRAIAEADICALTMLRNMSIPLCHELPERVPVDDTQDNEGDPE